MVNEVIRLEDLDAAWPRLQAKVCHAARGRVRVRARARARARVRVGVRVRVRVSVDQQGVLRLGLGRAPS